MTRPKLPHWADLLTAGNVAGPVGSVKVSTDLVVLRLACTVCREHPGRRAELAEGTGCMCCPTCSGTRQVPAPVDSAGAAHALVCGWCRSCSQLGCVCTCADPLPLFDGLLPGSSR